jgi:hypothetical protein
MPEKIWVEHRIKELASAIQRSTEVDRFDNTVRGWTLEMYRLLNRYNFLHIRPTVFEQIDAAIRSGAQQVDGCQPYIRKVETEVTPPTLPIPDGYRILHTDETVRPGDQYYNKFRKRFLDTIRLSGSKQSDIHQPYIRKIT